MLRWVRGICCATNDAVLRDKAVVVAQGGKIVSQCGGDDWGW